MVDINLVLGTKLGTCLGTKIGTLDACTKHVAKLGTNAFSKKCLTWGIAAPAQPHGAEGFMHTP